MNRIARTLLSIVVSAVVAFVAPGTAFAKGGGHGVRSSARSNVNSGSSGNRNQNTNVNRNTNVNSNRNTNVNVNSNRDVNVNVNHNSGYYGGGGCCYHDHYHPLATVAAVAVTAAVIGSMVNTLPPSCTMVMMNGFAYQQCGSTWYQPQMSGSSTTYVVVNAPR